MTTKKTKKKILPETKKFYAVPYRLSIGSVLYVRASTKHAARAYVEQNFSVNQLHRLAKNSGYREDIKLTEIRECVGIPAHPLAGEGD